MPKLKSVSGEETIRALEKLGFVRVRPCGSQPLHRELAEGTLRGILRQAQVTPDEFMALV